ncbi:MAG: tetratricopeptide repeat protein [Thermohalobaculum sp.]|nr:tetratricopeptide repeat protein [Thermohalobaculum sp.]
MAAVFLGLAGCSGSSSDSASQGSAYDSGFESLRQKDYAAAEAKFGALIRNNPDDSVAALALGVAHHEQGHWDEAEAQYQKALDKGGEVSVAETILDGESKPASGVTIAKLARENLEKLAADRPK